MKPMTGMERTREKGDCRARWNNSCTHMITGKGKSSPGTTGLPANTRKPSEPTLIAGCSDHSWKLNWYDSSHVDRGGPPPLSSFADQPFPPLLEGINELLPFLIRSPSHHTPPHPPSGYLAGPCVHTQSQSQGCVKDLTHNTLWDPSYLSLCKLHISRSWSGLCFAAVFKPLSRCYFFFTVISLTAFDASSMSSKRSWQEGADHAWAMLHPTVPP